MKNHKNDNSCEILDFNELTLYMIFIFEESFYRESHFQENRDHIKLKAQK